MRLAKLKFNYMVLFIAVIALIFVSLHFYFNFLAASLKVYEDPMGTGIIIENASSHTVRNIEVYLKENGQERLIKEISELGPKKISELTLPENLADQIELIVRAEFTPEIVEQIDTRELMKKSVTAKVFGPDTATAGKSFDLELELCNSSREQKGVSVEEEHNTKFFERAFIQKSYSMKPYSCYQLFFEFTPKMKGETQISFNIKAQNIIRKLEHKIMVS
ncbi:MAG: hypothetical protein AB1467_00195 [Candidatus Diapherotrites archaeon]